MLRFLLCFSIIVFMAAAAATQAIAADKGGELFKQHCALCHPDGGNIINQKKTLKKKDMHANNVRTPADIIKTMRKPGPGMNVFDEKMIPDSDAKKIAEYILKTFK